MGVLATLLACLCLPIYIPLLLNSVRQLLRGEVVLTRWSFLNIRVTRLTGGAAFVYNMAQILSVLLILNGLLTAVRQESLLPIFGGLLAGWGLGIIGGLLARTMQGDITETNIGASVVQSQNVQREGNRVTVTRVIRTPDGQTRTETRTFRVGPDEEDPDDDVIDAEFEDVDDDENR